MNVKFSKLEYEMTGGTVQVGDKEYRVIADEDNFMYSFGRGFSILSSGNERIGWVEFSNDSASTYGNWIQIAAYNTDAPIVYMDNSNRLCLKWCGFTVDTRTMNFADDGGIVGLFYEDEKLHVAVMRDGKLKVVTRYEDGTKMPSKPFAMPEGKIVWSDIHDDGDWGEKQDWADNTLKRFKIPQEETILVLGEIAKALSSVCTAEWTESAGKHKKED